MKTNRKEVSLASLDAYWLNIDTIVLSTILAFSSCVAVTSINILRVLSLIFECSPELQKK